MVAYTFLSSQVWASWLLAFMNHIRISLQVMAVNVFGVIRVTNAFLPLIRKSQGRIVNVSSILARTLFPFSGSYTITKSVIDAYTTILRLEMKRFNVKVVVVEPGNFMTATNFSTCNGQGGFAFNSRRMWDQLDEKIQNDYGKNSLERQICVTEKFVEISVSLSRLIGFTLMTRFYF